MTFDAVTEISKYVWGAVVLWVGYVHNELRSRPTKTEIILRQQINDIIQQEIKEDIKEMKEDIKEIKSRVGTQHDT